MGFTGDFAAVDRVRAKMSDLATTGGRAQTDIGRGVIAEVRGVLKEQFRTGTGPDGTPWKRTVRGRLALLSRKLPNVVRGKSVPGGVLFSSEDRAPWLIAHHEGHTFPPRQSRGHQMYFDARGRMVSRRRFGKLTAGAYAVRDARGNKGYARERKKGGYRFVGQIIKADAHTVSRRTLPPRHIYPVGTIPARWQNAINKGGAAGVMKWYVR